MLENISPNDISAAIALSALSFLASVVQGSTSLGDGIVLQITWGILQEILPYATTESSLGGDGMRVITLFMYIRLVVIPPYLLWHLWTVHKKKLKAEAKANSVMNKESSVVSSPQTSSSEIVAPRPAPIFLWRLFWLICIPNLMWCIMGVAILQNAKSNEIAFFIGITCISFSLIYMALKIWKTRPIDEQNRVPAWIRSILSPPFLVEGTNDTMTRHAQVALFAAFNLTGIMTTLAGVGGPPMMIFILWYEPPMNLTRFMFPVGTLIGASVRLCVSLFSGALNLSDTWGFFLPATIAGFVGINVGMRIGNVLSPSMYSTSIFSLVILTGVIMLTSNALITVPSLLLILVCLCLKQFWWDKATKSHVITENPPQISSTSVIDLQMSEKRCDVEDTDRKLNMFEDLQW